VQHAPVSLARLVEVVEGPAAIADLRFYFEPDRPPGTAPRCPGSRFEFLGGGGDRPETANRITVDDLVAVSLLAVPVPADAALELLEGQRGDDVAAYLERIPRDLAIGDAAAADHLGETSQLSVVWDLLEELHGMDRSVVSALLARKRPRLIPLADRVVRCAYGRPEDLEHWLHGLFVDDGARLAGRLSTLREAAGVPDTVSPLRVLHVLVWMRHRPVHLSNGCPGLV
jgi:hypothetical protein